MSLIIFNSVLKIDNVEHKGFWRVVASSSESEVVFLACIPEKNESEPKKSIHSQSILKPVPREILLDLHSTGILKIIELEVDPQLRRQPGDLDEKSQKIYQQRVKVMTDFFKHDKLCDALYSSRGLGELVSNAIKLHKCSRVYVYKLFKLLCVHGFEAGSLHDRYDMSGAPGVKRPFTEGGNKVGPKTNIVKVGGTEDFPQSGVTAEDRVKIIAAYDRIPNPKPSFQEMYDQIIEKVYVNKYIQKLDGRVAVMPPQGSFPNQRQVRYIIESCTSELDRLIAKTTAGHFTRNSRGLSGHAWEGIAGPGHRYAIDSTIGDIYLRSSINRAWIIGRPIVYIVVDVWSTAVVGFHVCLNGPSWETAKVALFSTVADPKLIGELWGYEARISLFPFPTLPYELMSDRGEYLSIAARNTSKELGYDATFNPAYRPDLKGLVEVLNRIAKDKQYFFLPGAIDARRKELELRTDYKESAYTLREYAQYLHRIFTHYNLTANRSHRLSSEMIAMGVSPTPAGLWRFGHEVGCGYLKSTTFSRLVTNLLPLRKSVITKKGIYLGQLEYDFSESANRNWTVNARNFGYSSILTHTFPGSTSKIWWPDTTSSNLHEFKLSMNARVPDDITHYDWADAYAYNNLYNRDREYERLSQSIQNNIDVDALTANAIRLTSEAEAQYFGPKVGVNDARGFETKTTTPAPVQMSVETESEPEENQTDAAYQELMDRIYSAANSQRKEEDDAI
ncbi:MAG: transposase [Methylotenera sp.]|nr:transposase [Methylotenera sp.]